MRCRFCANLSIETLVDLAKREFSALRFPSRAFYQHHASFRDLVKSADDGCDLCRLIADTFKGTRLEEWCIGNSWHGPACDPEQSLYADALAKNPSDVKLAINTTEVHVDTSLDSVQILTTLLVQVGLPDGEGGSLFHHSPSLILTLSTLRERPIKLGGFRIGRFQVDPDLRSAKNFDIARSWLKECRTHPCCFTSQIPRLPTRVVDIGPLDAPMRPRILLTHGAEGDYIALSHCWGGSISTLLNAATYQAYQESLPFQELPANFQDALVISKELGIRYIWIDSLCIIQDSRSDWAQESKKMAIIYAKATLTLSGWASERSTAGFFQYDKFRSLAPNPVSLRVFKDISRTDQVQVEVRLHREETFAGLYYFGPLSGRGWALQEYFLSPRSLLFGRRQIYWRCLMCMQSADAMPEGCEFPNETFQAASSAAFSGFFPERPKAEVDTPALLQDYYELARAFQQRKLTKSFDKLPAFSAIARSLQPAIGGEYLAGLWTSGFHQGLLWFADQNFVHSKPYRAPSWSWMVSDEIVYFMDVSWLQPNKMDLELLQHEVELEDKTNPFGPVLSIHVVVKGLTAPLLRRSRSSRILAAVSCSKRRHGSVSLDEPAFNLMYLSFQIQQNRRKDSKCIFECRNGDKVMTKEVKQAISRSDLLILLVRVGENANGSGYTRAYGLALRPVHNPSSERGIAYERFGLVKIDEPEIGWFESWKLQTLVLV